MQRDIVFGVLLPTRNENKSRQYLFRCDITHQNDYFDDYYRYTEVLLFEPRILSVDGLIYAHRPWGVADSEIELAIDFAIDRFVEKNEPGKKKRKYNVNSWRK